MAEQFEERTVTLKATKQRVQPLTGGDGSNCGPWYFKKVGGHTYSCRVCWTAPAPTSFPYEECIQLPD